MEGLHIEGTIDRGRSDGEGLQVESDEGTSCGGLLRVIEGLHVEAEGE